MKTNSSNNTYNRINRGYYDVEINDLVELKQMGFSEYQIARELGVSKSYINKVVGNNENIY